MIRTECFVAKHVIPNRNYSDYLNIDGLLSTKQKAALYNTPQEALDAITKHVAKYRHGGREIGWTIEKWTFGIIKEEEV